MSIHPVFNVSLLRKYYGDRLLPKVVQVEDDAEYEIDLILHHQGCPCVIIDSTYFDGRGMVQKRTCGSWKWSCNMHKSSYNALQPCPHVRVKPAVQVCCRRRCTGCARGTWQVTYMLTYLRCWDTSREKHKRF